MDTLNVNDEDQADIDQRKREEKRRKRMLNKIKDFFKYKTFLVEEEHFKRQTQVVQRNLPRPNDINLTILRPANTEGPMSDFQKVKIFLLFFCCININIFFILG